MADERAAYTDSSRRSEQLSCTKYFHVSYGLFYMNFQRFKQYSEITGIILIRILNSAIICILGGSQPQSKTCGAPGLG